MEGKFFELSKRASKKGYVVYDERLAGRGYGYRSIYEQQTHNVPNLKELESQIALLPSLYMKEGYETVERAKQSDPAKAEAKRMLKIQQHYEKKREKEIKSFYSSGKPVKSVIRDSM